MLNRGSTGLDPAFPTREARHLVRRALEEDMPWGDVTTEALVPSTVQATGRFVVKEEGIVCGLDVAALVFEELDPDVRFTPSVSEGEQVAPETMLAEIAGRARSILMGERTALNFLQRMSGIATATARYVAAIAGSGARIVDTRKTVPGLRVLDKYAVRCGGGSNHRFSLSDGVLVKDNHLVALGGPPEKDPDRLSRALLEAGGAVPHTLRIEVEVDRLDQIEAALTGGADVILLDNMQPDELRRAVDLIVGRALTEASGGVSLETVRKVAFSGVDLISVGALTHSVRALDIGLDLSPVDR